MNLVIEPKAAAPDLAAIKQRQQATWAPATSPSSARRCRSSASRCAKPSTCAPANACSTSPPATATRRWPRRAASPKSRRPTTCRRCSRAAARAPRPTACRGLQVADAEALPFDDASFDVVLSTFGVMFTPDQARAAREMLRVVPAAAALASRTGRPTALSASCSASARHMPPPAGASPALWGTEAHIDSCSARRRRVDPQRTTNLQLPLPLRRPLDTDFQRLPRPTHKAFAALDESAVSALEEDITALLNQLNIAGAGVAGGAGRISRGRRRQALDAVALLDGCVPTRVGATARVPYTAVYMLLSVRNPDGRPGASHASCALPTGCFFLPSDAIARPAIGYLYSFTAPVMPET